MVTTDDITMHEYETFSFFFLFSNVLVRNMLGAEGRGDHAFAGIRYRAPEEAK
jgi:hypothetical protein